ncbi:MAG: hypothetical protein ABFS12_04855 [Bacteroidota bacterium]
MSCNNIDVDSEKKAIISVIENETTSFFNRDFEQQAKTFLHDESLTVLVAKKNWYGYVEGWSQLSANNKKYFEESSNPLTDKFENKNYKIKVYGKSAWAIYDEYVYSSKGNFLKKVINVRFLEKVDGEWKIVYLSHVNTTSFEND